MTELAYKIVDVNETNLDVYDLFCHKSRKKGEGYQNKVRWVKNRFKEGLCLKLLLINEGPKRGFRSRGFIEYIPGEFAWRGIDAKGYMVIHCIWVVGRNKKKGYGTKLLEECIKDAKTMNGIAVVTSNKGWLPRSKLFIKNGFEKVDTAPPDFELYVKRFSDNAPLPKFISISKGKLESHGSGLIILESHQCPYSSDLVNLYREMAKEAKIPVKIKYITSCNDARDDGVHPYGTFCVVLDGRAVSYKPGDPREVKQALELSRQAS
ncbi:MAG: GNAT family N-acetyltransferase [Candidatus Bathyarchaeota archaeon]|jgi:hypothetical protein